jgi:uncharacterized protein YyaL (SSP411 family)
MFSLAEAPLGLRGFCTRPRDLQDTATPSGNAMAITALLKLAGFTDGLRYVDLTHQALAQMQPMMAQYPRGFGQWLQALSPSPLAAARDSYRRRSTMLALVMASTPSLLSSGRRVSIARSTEQTQTGRKIRSTCTRTGRSHTRCHFAR